MSLKLTISEKKTVSFFNDGIEEQKEVEFINIEREIEVYVRK